MMRTLTFLAIITATCSYLHGYNRLNSFQQKHHVISGMASDFYSFLTDRDESKYSSQILRLVTESIKKAISTDIKIIEVEFPPSRKTDVGATETLGEYFNHWIFELSLSFSLDLSISFALKLITPFISQYGKDLWVLLPDKKEASALRMRVGRETPFTLGAIDDFPRLDANPPRLVLVINPGFNVDEWINIPKIPIGGAPLVILNGNLARLRNGYYPGFFYPGLAAVSKFYTQAVQVFSLTPISISGNRLGAWIAKVYPNDWTLLIKSPKTGQMEIAYESVKELDPQSLWRKAKDEYASRWGKDFL